MANTTVLATTEERNKSQVSDHDPLGTGTFSNGFNVLNNLNERLLRVSTL